MKNAIMLEQRAKNVDALIFSSVIKWVEVINFSRAKSMVRKLREISIQRCYVVLLDDLA